jgi:hypothetical protein
MRNSKPIHEPENYGPIQARRRDHFLLVTDDVGRDANCTNAATGGAYGLD